MVHTPGPGPQRRGQVAHVLARLAGAMRTCLREAHGPGQTLPRAARAVWTLYEDQGVTGTVIFLSMICCL